MRPTKPAHPSAEEQDTSLSIHIVSVSAALVGVCLTVIGLIQVALHIKGLDTQADNILAGDAVLFLLSCLLAYASIRSRKVTRKRRLERLADACFLLALSLMTMVCAVIAFELL